MSPSEDVMGIAVAYTWRERPSISDRNSWWATMPDVNGWRAGQRWQSTRLQDEPTTLAGLATAGVNRWLKVSLAHTTCSEELKTRNPASVKWTIAESFWL